MEQVIVIDGVSKRFEDVTALNNVSLDVQAGEIFGLIGPNGAGKTSLVRTITGTIEPDSGEIHVFGEAPGQGADDRIGFLPQAFAPPARLTGREILSYYAGLYPSHRIVDEVLAEVGMSDTADRWFERLSGGEQRRICVGITLINDPELLILDEPTTGIDPSGRRDLWNVLESMRQEGRSILLTTHDMAEATRLSDRVGLLSGGQLIEIGTPEGLIERHGGEGRLVMQLSEPTLEQPIELPEYQSRIVDEELVVEGVTSTELESVLRELQERQVTFSRVTWEQPTLEDVFLTLTEFSEKDTS